MRSGDAQVIWLILRFLYLFCGPAFALVHILAISMWNFSAILEIRNSRRFVILILCLILKKKKSFWQVSSSRSPQNLLRLRVHTLFLAKYRSRWRRFAPFASNYKHIQHRMLRKNGMVWLGKFNTIYSGGTALTDGLTASCRIQTKWVGNLCK